MSSFIDFFYQIFSPTMMLFTILMIIVTIYWLIVICGMIDIEILDFGDFDSLAGSAGEAVESASQSTESSLQSILGFLNIGTVPVTLILSIVIFQMWLMSYFIHILFPDSLKNIMPPLMFTILLFIALGIVSLFLTCVTSRPFRRIFKTTTIHGHAYLEGKICRIKTSEVTSKFGQAEIQVKDSLLLLSVRSLKNNDLKKGDEAVILEYNTDKDTYTVKKFL